MALQKFRDMAPDLATLQQLAANGPLAIEVMRFAGPGVPYEHIDKQENLTPEVVQNIYPWVQAKYGGGKPYRFKVYVPAAPGISPLEWERSVPGLPKQPDGMAQQPQAGAQWTQQPMPQPFAPQQPYQLPGAPMQYPQYPVPQYTAPAMPAYSFPYMYPQPASPPWWQAPQQQQDGNRELERRLDDERHRRELERYEAKAKEDRELLMREIAEMRRQNEEEKRESSIVKALEALKDNQKHDDSSTSWGAVVSAVLQSIAQSNSTAAEQVRMAATQAIEASREAAARGMQQSPHLELLLKHMLENSSPKAMADMAATASTIASDSINMMAQAAERMGEASDDSKAIWKSVIEQVSKVGQAMLGGKAANGSSGSATVEGAAELTDGLSEFKDLAPFIKNLRKTVSEGKTKPEEAAGLLADLLYRFHFWGVSTDLAKEFVTKPFDTAKKVLRMDDAYCNGFCGALVEAAKKAGFTAEDLGLPKDVQVTQVQTAPTPTEAPKN
jgi:hypothetical protein